MSSPKLAICVASMDGSTSPWPGEINSWCQNSSDAVPVIDHLNTPEENDGVVGSYQALYEVTMEPILAFIHDDVICREKGWDTRVLAAFEDPKVGVVGFGGARGHGDLEMYKTPYRLEQLRRFDYLSNVDDAEVHGARFTGSADVSVLDGFALIVRRDLLDRAGGWRGLAAGCDFFCYDYALCAMARRLHYHVRLVGIGCHHLGGRTSVSLPSSPITSQDAYDKSHRWFYETYRDVMPWRVHG